MRVSSVEKKQWKTGNDYDQGRKWRLLDILEDEADSEMQDVILAGTTWDFLLVYNLAPECYR